MPNLRRGRAAFLIAGFAVAAAIAAVWLAVRPQLPTEWVVSGKVEKDIGGVRVPVSGIEVRIDKENATLGFGATTDANGEYTFRIAGVSGAVGSWILRPTDLRQPFSPSQIEVFLFSTGEVGVGPPYPSTFNFVAQARSFRADFQSLPSTPLGVIGGPGATDYPPIPADTYDLPLQDENGNQVGTIPVAIEGSVWHPVGEDIENMIIIGDVEAVRGKIRLLLTQISWSSPSTSEPLWAKATYEVSIGAVEVALSAFDANGDLVMQDSRGAGLGPYSLSIGPQLPLPRVAVVEIEGVAVKTYDQLPILWDP